MNEVFDIGSGLSKPADDFGSGFPFLSFKEIFNNFFIPKELTELVESSEEERDKCSVKKGDVFLTRTSETVKELGMSCVALKDYKNATFNGFTKRLRPNGNFEIVPEYAGYYFRSSKFRNEVTALSSASTRASLNNEMIGRLQILLPSKIEQEEIAAVLICLDRKISNLRQQNETLERIAQTLFKHWFVDFEFPNEDGKPYKSSGGEMVRSELGEIPAGWFIEPLDEVANFLNGLALQNYPAKSDNYLPVIKIREMKAGITANTEKASFEIPSQYVIDNGDVIFSWSGSLEIIIWCFGKGALNQHLFKVSSTKYPKWFYYLWNLEHLNHFRAIAKSKATTMGHIQRKHLSEALCYVPDDSQLRIMNSTMSPILEKLIKNSLQIQTLIKARDVLLPQLMSGKLRITE